MHAKEVTQFLGEQESEVKRIDMLMLSTSIVDLPDAPSFESLCDRVPLVGRLATGGEVLACDGKICRPSTGCAYAGGVVGFDDKQRSRMTMNSEVSIARSISSLVSR